MEPDLDVAAALSAYTGYLLTESFADMHFYVERLLGRSIFTHEFARPEIGDEIRAAMRANGDFERATKALKGGK